MGTDSLEDRDRQNTVAGAVEIVVGMYHGVASGVLGNQQVVAEVVAAGDDKRYANELDN
jgi:hypothetical protein